MRARCRHLEPGALGGGDQFAARAMHFNAQLADVLADARPRLDDGLVQLVFDLLRNIRRSRRDELGDMRTQLARRGINDLELFLDANGEAMSHGAALWIAGSCWGLRTSYHTAARRKIHQCPVSAGLQFVSNGKRADRNVCPTADLLGWTVPYLT